MSLHAELHQGLDAMSSGRRRFLHQAYEMLPPRRHPRILDVGCGRGGPTLELARLGGDVTGVDLDVAALRELTRSAQAAGLADRVRARRASMSALDFTDESFEVIWSEGAVRVIGFEEALRAWRPLLTPQGNLVVHEMVWLRPNPPDPIRDHWQSTFPGIRTVAEYAAALPRQDYEWIGHLTLPEDFWWEEYYRPLQSRVALLRERYREDRGALEVLRRQVQEIELYRRHASWYGSAYLLMRKAAPNERRNGGDR